MLHINESHKGDSMIVLYISINAGKSATAGTNNSSYIAKSWVATEVPPTQGTQDRHTAKKISGESLVTDIPAGDGKIANLFCSAGAPAMARTQATAGQQQM